jgi:transcriptional regulator with XRE-family HTH domain
MDVRKLVGGNVARLRKAKGLKQEPFSVAAGVTQSYLSQIENGHVNLTLLGLNELAEALSVEPAELFRQITIEQNDNEELAP